MASRWKLILTSAIVSKSHERDVFVVKQGDEWTAKRPHVESDIQMRPAGRKSLAQLFADAPFKGLDLKSERDPDTGLPVSL
jgi:hypothetical protein